MEQEEKKEDRNRKEEKNEGDRGEEEEKEEDHGERSCFFSLSFSC